MFLFLLLLLLEEGELLVWVVLEGGLLVGGGGGGGGGDGLVLEGELLGLVGVVLEGELLGLGLVGVVLEGELLVVLDGWSWRGELDCGSFLHAFLDELEGLLGRRVVSREVGLGQVEARGWRWRREDRRRLVDYLVEDLWWGRRRWWGELDGNVVGGVVDDDLLGRGRCSSWGAP